MKKKILFFVMTLFVACLLTVCVSAAEVDGIYYSFTNTDAYPGYDGTATITSENRTLGTITEIIIPEIVNYDSDGDGVADKRYIVTEIASGAIGANGGSNSPVVSIVVPKTVKKIGEHAFRQLKYVESIVIKAQGYNPVTGETSKVTFSNAEFYQTTSLKTLDMSESNITKLGSVCLQGCTSLTEVWFSPNIEIIGSSAFANCSELTTVHNIENVKEIYSTAFQACRKLTGDLVFNQLETLSNNAFQFAAITSVDLSKSPLEKISDNAFYQCESLTTVVLPSCLKEICLQAFRTCKSLTTINLPSGLTSLGSSAFYGSKITGDFVLNSLTHIGENALRETNITSVDFTGSTFTSTSTHTLRSCPNLTTVVLPSTLTEICDGVFYGCSKLTSASIPSSIRKFGLEAFRGSKITDAVVVDYLESIGNHAFRDTNITCFIAKDGSATSLGDDATFYNCTSLTQVVLPSSINTIYKYTFGNCSNLKYIVASNNISSIDSSALSNCTALVSIIIRGNDASAISSVIGSSWATAPFSEFDPATAGTKTIYYGAVNAKDSTTTFVDFDAFDKEFSSWDAITNEKTAYAPIFEAQGYSTNDDKNAIATGFSVTKASLEAYESLVGGEVNFGIVIFNPKYLADGSFLTADADGATLNASGGFLMVDIGTEYSNCSLSVQGFNSGNSGIELVFAGFAYTDDITKADIFQKEYVGTSESPIASPMVSKVTRTEGTLYTTTIASVCTPAEITTGKEGLGEYTA